jgi:hypothetical protein
MDRVQTLIEEIRTTLADAGSPCNPVECLRQAYELEGYLPQLEGERRFAAQNAVERVRLSLQQMPPASREACLVHMLLTELRRYALMVLQLEHLRAREFATLLHSRDTLHFVTIYHSEVELDIAEEEALVAKWDARLRQRYHPRFAATLAHYQSIMPLDETRWWWYLDRQAGDA